MKTFYKISLFLLLLHFTLLLPQRNTAQTSVSFQVFYDNLSPYGSWMQTSAYGYVWIPRVAVGFSPYHTGGYWVYTDYGWTWYSNYAWGWAPFHYGRWYYDPYYGWVWVPDDEWGPAWVCWRTSPDYYGWAPMGPGVTISVAYSSGYSVPYNHWTFVRHRDFGRNNVSNYYVANTRNNTIIRNTTIINNVRSDNRHNVRYAAGPDRGDVQKRTGRNVAAMTIRERTAPGQQSSRSEMNLYRPEVRRGNAKPSRITEGRDIKAANNLDPAKRNRPDKQPALPRNNRVDNAPIANPSKGVIQQRNMENSRRNAPSKPQPRVNPLDNSGPVNIPQRQNIPHRPDLPRNLPRGHQNLPIEKVL
ncbi:DUF6600 domain-containing protein [Flavobacterium sangjuense]|uniref:YXWGXW repeat-containing protein n=1 Tax=Flavobacterium sangjuense TaxID=2518177 RepID=A0A4P7PQM7_9FLAO|nr:DUF6600 domain-containing protein [Flavobacterium sangjuense]QBZ96675.1 hypothetical protein GS03_00152 [Flavobacterium sangjuense]